MTELLRVGAVARQPDPPDEQEQVRRLRATMAHSPPERREADEIVAGYERGEWRPVRLELFADILEEEGRIQRFDSVHVEGAWFKAPHGSDNVRHARETADQAFDRLHAHLNEEGFAISTEQLESVQFVLELDERVAARLGSARE